jgi:hypothetical protein
MFVVSVVSKDKKEIRRTVKTEKQVLMKYRVQEQKENIPVKATFSAFFNKTPGVHPAPCTMVTVSF